MYIYIYEYISTNWNTGYIFLMETKHFNIVLHRWFIVRDRYNIGLTKWMLKIVILCTNQWQMKLVSQYIFLLHSSLPPAPTSSFSLSSVLFSFYSLLYFLLFHFLISMYVFLKRAYFKAPCCFWFLPQVSSSVYFLLLNMALQVEF